MCCSNSRHILSVVVTIFLIAGLAITIGGAAGPRWIVARDRQTNTERVSCGLFWSTNCDVDFPDSSFKNVNLAARIVFIISIVTGIIALLLQCLCENNCCAIFTAILIFLSFATSISGAAIYVALFLIMNDRAGNMFRIDFGISYALVDAGSSIMFVAFILSCIVPCLKNNQVVVYNLNPQRKRLNQPVEPINVTTIATQGI